jgi:hypothetical protein
MSHFPSIVEFDDVKDSPKVRMTLPGPLLIGTRLLLNLVVRRKNGSRTEELHVQGEFRVKASAFDATGLVRQVVSVEATKIAPTWRSVRNALGMKRKPPPAKAPRTVIA